MTGPSHSADELAAKLTDSISIEGERALVRSPDGSMEIAGPVTFELGDPVGDPAHDSVKVRIDGTYISSASIGIEHSDGTWSVSVIPTEVDLRMGELRHRASHDVLTGLANREAFTAAVATAIDSARLSPTKPAVFFVDLDDFKRVNDTFGHETGDELLIEVGRRLRTASRPRDTVARFAGDEFVVLCEGLSDQGIAHRIAGRIVAALASPVDLDGLKLTAAASVGVAMAEAGIDAEELLRRADTAMFRAKGTSQAVAHFEGDPGSDELSGPQLEDIEKAVATNRLDLRYQVIRSVATGVVAGVRPIAYLDDGNGLVPLAEALFRIGDPNLTADVGRWLIQMAVGQVAAMDRSDGRAVRLHLALRANDVLDLGVVGMLRSALDKTQLDPRRVVLEVTGDLLGQRATDVAVPRLHAAGVRLAIEGFGRGRSSLGLLETQAAEFMRLDAGLVQGIVTDERRRRTLGALIELAHANDMAAIVTGVGDPEQLAVLRILGCELVEGDVFGEPLAPEDLV